MKNLMQFSLSVLWILLFVSPMAYSQANYVESFTVADNVEVVVNTSFTNVVFETWNKNKVEVEAFIEGDDLSKKQKQELMEQWDLKVAGNSKKVSISSNAAMAPPFQMGPMPAPDFVGPLLDNLVLPIMQNIHVPPLPEEFMDTIGSIHFDYDEFKKDEEGYMKKFEAQMDQKFGKDFEKRMEEWSENIEKSWNAERADSIGEAYGKQMEAWGEDFGKRMEAWGEEYGKKMEAWAQQFEREGGNYSKTVTKTPHGTSIVIKGSKGSSSNAKKTIIIRLPKNTKTEVNVRHGDLKMADVQNVRANLDYTPFRAKSIDGGQTLINASYAPVNVDLWKQGVLNVKFVDECRIETVQNINLQANSSDVRIGTVSKQAFLSGSFGDLEVSRISDGFETIDIRLENTDAKLGLPAAAFSFYFTGRKSTLNYPKSLQLKESKNARGVLVKGFNQNNSSTKTITINSNYSNISLQ